MIAFYTDGSASPNPGPGGFAVIDQAGQPVYLGSSKQSTNIRMEAQAIIKALELADGRVCQIYTDSQFWISVLTEWAPNWQKNNWTKKKGEIKNLDLVKQAFELYNQSKATLIWVKAHNNQHQNEAADDWANQARKQHLNQLIKENYEEIVN